MCEPKYKENIRGSLLQDIKIGDGLECIADKNFFGKQEDADEKYLGYVYSLSSVSIGISTTPSTNRYHGYVSGESLGLGQLQHVTNLEVSCIKKYRKL